MTQLFSFTQEVYNSLDNGQQTDIIVMDFSKAFGHHKPILKLPSYSITGETIDWVRSFLHKFRSQRVAMAGHLSDEDQAFSGVPQGGSVIGPRLFPSYINDLPESIKSSTRLFADETILVIFLTITSRTTSTK